MKIDVRRKTLLIFGGVIGVWIYLSNVTFSLRREQAKLGETISVTQAAIEVASRELEVLRERESRAEAQLPMFAWAGKLANSVPQPYLVDGPAKIARALRERAGAQARVHLAQLLPFPALASHAIARWQIRVENTRVLPLGEALADLENIFLLGKIRGLAISRSGAGNEVSVAIDLETLVQP